MSTRRAYKLYLTLKSPFLFQGLVNTRIGVDAAFLRDEEGRPVIPAAQVKGNLRAACQALPPSVITPNEIATLFGTGSDDHLGSYEPFSGATIFGDLAATAGEKSLITTRIAIDEESGTVKPGALQVIELAAPLGASMRFEGSLIIRTGGLDIGRIEQALRRALRLIPAIGALKSVGFGEVDAGASDLVFEHERMMGLASPETAKRMTFRIRLDRPLLVDTDRAMDNVFIGSPIIPGAAIKGALARELEDGKTPDLEDALSKLSISHAFPANADGQINWPIPNSAVSYDGEVFEDTLVKGGFGAAPMPRGARMATFAAHGKRKTKENFRKSLKGRFQAFEYEELPRTHIAIDKESLTSAEEKLYTTVSIGVKNHLWQFTADAGAVRDEALALKLLGTIARGLDGVGRGLSSLEIESKKADEQPHISSGDVFNLTLLTPAILFDPLDRDTSLADQMRRYWRETGQDTELLNFHMRYRMAGGYVAARRRLYGQSIYYPFVLTEPGSVFRVRCQSEKSRDALADMLRYGLPIPPLREAEPVSWRNCPYVRENGYGQIALNALKHEAMGANIAMIPGVDDV